MIDIQNEFTTVIMELSFGESVTCDKSLTNIFKSVIVTVKLRMANVILTIISQLFVACAWIFGRNQHVGGGRKPSELCADIY